MLVHVNQDEGTVLAASGSIDFYSARELLGRAERELLRPACLSLSLDLSEVSFITFEGVAALLSAYDLGRRLSKAVRVVGALGQPRELLQLSGVLDVLTATGGGVGRALER